LLNIIEDIIRLSEFDEGKISREYSAFDLYELTESVAEALQAKADEKHIAVSIIGDRLQITANRQMMDELLYNLIDNAIKYNRENGAVTVALSKEDGFCKIAVSDTGIGIPTEHQGHVFERFYRVDKSRSKKTGGTGLGLSIVKHIAEHHGGRVELESAPDEGTTVACYIGE
jgi:two-component system phosphate regulon sensor histidine kinase PhoR